VRHLPTPADHGKACEIPLLEEAGGRLRLTAALTRVRIGVVGEPKSVQAYGGGTSPGYGYGDKNHDKSGPLGLIRKKTGLIKKKK
jgi:hypothetical protein